MMMPVLAFVFGSALVAALAYALMPTRPRRSTAGSRS